MFKIVKTLEDDGVFFTIVPEKWEKNGLLYWPPGKNTVKLEKMRRDRFSEPQSTWLGTPCEVRRSGIPSFVEAMRQEKEIIACSDTEAEEQLQAITSKGKCGSSKLPTSNLDLNDLFETTFLVEESHKEEIEMPTAEILTEGEVPAPDVEQNSSNTPITIACKKKNFL